MGDVKRYAIRSQLINLALFDERADGGFVKYEDYARAEQQVAELQRETAALRAPVTDEELTPHLLGKKWPITEAFDALIAARASAQGEKGNGNGNL